MFQISVCHSAIKISYKMLQNFLSSFNKACMHLYYLHIDTCLLGLFLTGYYVLGYLLLSEIIIKDCERVYSLDDSEVYGMFYSFLFALLYEICGCYEPISPRGGNCGPGDPP